MRAEIQPSMATMASALALPSRAASIDRWRLWAPQTILPALPHDGQRT
jgi:hypothetical protein